MANSPCHSLEKGHTEMGTTRDIRAAVQAELAFDPLVDATDITVRNMNGEVALNGTVPSYPQCLQAAAAAQRVAGVKNAHNHLGPSALIGHHRPPGHRRGRRALGRKPRPRDHERRTGYTRPIAPLVIRGLK